MGEHVFSVMRQRIDGRRDPRVRRHWYAILRVARRIRYTSGTTYRRQRDTQLSPELVKGDCFITNDIS